MNHLKTVTIIFALVLSAALAAMLTSSKKENRNKDVRLKETSFNFTNTESILKIKEQTIELLEGKVNQLVQALTNSTAQLLAANETIHAYELAETERRKQEEESRTMLAQVPEPKVTVVRDSAGKETKDFTFPIVMSKNGSVLARDAKFGGLYGRLVVFRTESGPTSMDVEAVHPAILRYLSIDAGEATQKQARMDAAWQAKRASDYQAHLVEQRAQQERWESQERVRIEQAKANAEIAKLNAEERAKLESAENERIQANAAARMADAALSGALAPITYNQNANVVPIFIRR